MWALRSHSGGMRVHVYVCAPPPPHTQHTFNQALSHPPFPMPPLPCGKASLGLVGFRADQQDVPFVMGIGPPFVPLKEAKMVSRVLKRRKNRRQALRAHGTLEGDAGDGDAGAWSKDATVGVVRLPPCTCTRGVTSSASECE